MEASTKTPNSAKSAKGVPVEVELPLALLCSFLFFLARRPISGSNSHYLGSRLRGLKSLIPVLEQFPLDSTLMNTLRDLEATTPGSFARKARNLQMNLLASRATGFELPADFLISGAPPRVAEGVREATVILGPSIGIGDEVTLFPLPSALKRAGIARVEVHSMYRQLWDRVVHADSVHTYPNHRALLELLGSRADSPDHLFVLADFEKPGLAPVLAHDPKVYRYLEISLGAQTAVLVDRLARRLHSFRLPSEHVINYYRGLDKMLHWLGLELDDRTRFTSLFRAERQVSDQEMVLFVSPFTSKFDPSSIYWSRLVRRLFEDFQGGGPVRVRIDAGTNNNTRSFAEILRRSIAMGVPRGVTVEVATEPDGARLPFDQLWRELEASTLVLCTDSFLAHAAPLFGPCVMVLAGPELANWRVPYARSFYFDATESADRLGEAMRAVMLSMGHPSTSSVRPARALLHVATSLLRATNALSSRWREGQPVAANEYQEFVSQYDLTVEGLSAWPAQMAPLIEDVDYLNRWRQPNHGIATELTEYVDARLPSWLNTNLYKYLGLACQQ